VGPDPWLSGARDRASGYGLGEGLEVGDPVPDGAVVFPGSVGDVLPEAVPEQLASLIDVTLKVVVAAGDTLRVAGEAATLV